MTLDPEIGNRIRTDFYLVVNGVCERQCLEVHNWRTDSGQRPSDEWLQEQGYYEYLHVDPPTCDPYTQKVERLPCPDWIVDEVAGTVSPTYQVVQLTEDEKEEVLERAWADFRLERQKKLIVTDFTQLQDSPYQGETAEAWAQYRQALRDLPSITTDPLNPVWPTHPN